MENYKEGCSTVEDGREARRLEVPILRPAVYITIAKRLKSHARVHKQQAASPKKPTVGHGIVPKRTGTVEAGKGNPECCAQKLAAVYLCEEISVSRTVGLALHTNATGMNVKLILLTCLHLTPKTPCIFYIPERFALKVFNTSR